MPYTTHILLICNLMLFLFNFLLQNFKDMASICINCSETFKLSKDKRRYERYSLDKTIQGTGISVGDALTDFLRIKEPLTPLNRQTVHNRCLCLECFSLLVKLTKAKLNYDKSSDEFYSRSKSAAYINEKASKTIKTPVSTPHGKKRKLWTRTPTATPRSVKKLATPGEEKYQALGRKDFKKNAIKHIANGNYGTSLHILLKNSKKARRQTLHVISKVIQAEMKQCKSKATVLKQPLSLDKLESLTWPNLLGDVQPALPFTWTLLSNMMASSSKLHQLSTSQSCGRQVPAMGMVVSTILYCRYPSIFKTVPGLVSTLLFKHGNSHAVSMLYLKLCNVFQYSLQKYPIVKYQ